MKRPLSTIRYLEGVTNTNHSETLTVETKETLKAASTIHYWIRISINLKDDGSVGSDIAQYGLFNSTFTVANDATGELYIKDIHDGQVYITNLEW